MGKELKQSVVITATPHDLFEALLDSRKHAKFTGAAAKIDRKAGGKFTAWDGSLSGINVEIVKDQRIVQAWRSDSWPKGSYSIATFEFAKAAGGKTKLTFTQSGIPAKDFKDISEGWKLYYWEPLKAHFEKS